MDKPYRPCVVAVIQNEEGLLLAGERADQTGAWQVPQGGIDPGETPEIAVFRELHEEIGNDALEIIGSHGEWVRYDFPPEFAKGRMAQWAGQEQRWFLLKFKPGETTHLERSEGEFRALKWLTPRELLKGIVAWKREAYEVGLKAFKLL